MYPTPAVVSHVEYKCRGSVPTGAVGSLCTGGLEGGGQDGVKPLRPHGHDGVIQEPNFEFISKITRVTTYQILPIVLYQSLSGRFSAYCTYLIFYGATVRLQINLLATLLFSGSYYAIMFSLIPQSGVTRCSLSRATYGWKIHQGMANETNSQQVTPVQQPLNEIKQRPEAGTTLVHPSPPNGGQKAWIQVLVSHLCVFNSFGYINSFGIFQQYYASTLSLPPSTISWVGSIQILLVYFVGAFSGRALDAGHYRLVLFAGVTLQVVGVFMTSLSRQYWQLLLAQGICQGLGDGLIFCPAVANTATYFTRSRTMAISCVACGGATGGMVFPAIAQALLNRIGFPWTLRVMGFVILLNAAVILSLARTRLPSRSTGPLVEWKAFTELPYLLYTVSMFFAFWGIWIAYYYVSSLLGNEL
jgi:hypothetical protein